MQNTKFKLFYFLVVPLSLAFCLLNSSAVSAVTAVPDENALYNLNQNLLPDQVVKDIKPQTEGVLDKAGHLLGSVADLFKKFLGFTPSRPSLFIPRAQSQQQSLVPDQVRSEVSEPVERASESLGQKTGVYSLSCPEKIKDEIEKSVTHNTRNFEESCYRFFPDNINPITGQ